MPFVFKILNLTKWNICLLACRRIFLTLSTRFCFGLYAAQLCGRSFSAYKVIPVPIDEGDFFDLPFSALSVSFAVRWGWLIVFLKEYRRRK